MQERIKYPIDFDIVLVPDVVTGQVTSFFLDFPKIVAVGDGREESIERLVKIFKLAVMDGIASKIVDS